MRVSAFILTRLSCNRFRAPILPLRLGSYAEGPCLIVQDSTYTDVISEALDMFRVAILMKGGFAIETPADKVLIYIHLWIHKCIQMAAAEVKSKSELAEYFRLCSLTDLALPGDSDFPLNRLFSQRDKREGSLCQKYLKQLRYETAIRLIDKLYENEENLSKWWMQYANYQFLNISI